MDNWFKYVMLSLKNGLFVLVIFSGSYLNAQDLFNTQNASVLITTISSDSIFKLSSKEVVIFLNNNKGILNITIDKSTLTTSNKQVNEELALMNSDEITLLGKINLEKIDNNDHSPIDFLLEGVIAGNNIYFSGRGRLEHISSEGYINCLLTLNFNLNKEELGLNLESIKLKDQVQIDVVQVLLNN